MGLGDIPDCNDPKNPTMENKQPHQSSSASEASSVGPTRASLSLSHSSLSSHLPPPCPPVIATCKQITDATVETGDCNNPNCILCASCSLHQRKAAVDEFTATFAGLMGISLFGASLAWSALFSGSRGDLVLFSWAAAAFVSAGVSASGMCMILKSEELDISRGAKDRLPRHMLHMFAISSGLLAFGGIVMMSVAVMHLAVDGGDTAMHGLSTPWRKSLTWAAGIFTIIASLFYGLLAFGLMIWYKCHPGSKNR
ncbi:hypothetical protein SERLA73DRAFT_185048 [Serpula lacrymans var. lacrymans S7.3]|uniref:Uncharacterized protein n=2 Tax=Serpula lacrymans var. lacrymans TaxID=341189 RepID=F8Q3Z3_SERL3|nr:uncharacterized protein SERLADRAFT_473275 [Serpula lacrymans var. lacrymans S7.9]EGN96849.1 hypothetical protein SERLA73DRAFT_185048 [Serpula lacrymans var. lacrymans S7.3]EGO22449.1 hypothetical protein SERLADRAFT_473275 [Serpula lacrymans var. lacrymans S7.9]